MPECSYCDDSFAGEEAYLDHLADEHGGELSAIDERRVAEHTGGDDDGGFPTGPVVLGGVLLVAFLVMGYVIFVAGGSNGSDPASGGTGAYASLPAQGDQAVIDTVEREPDRGGTHIEYRTTADYQKVPPTSGPHYDPQYALSAGFYTDQRRYEAAVHTLEHGGIVVYYDPAALDDAAESHLRSYASNYTRSFGAFVAVPTRQDEPDAPFVLTAWRHRLTLDSYDPDAVRAFVAEYIGRGPEGAFR